jgi:hypothetical protein
MENPLLPELSLANWPVSNPNNTFINDMLQSGKWETNPLPLFTQDSNDIVPPSYYDTILPGSISQIAFILDHESWEDQH